MIDRRSVANILALGLLFEPLKAAAQLAQLAPRLAVVGTLSGTLRGKAHGHMVRGLREAGFVEGKDYRLESRYSQGKPAAFPALAAELVKLEVDVIYAVGPVAAHAARAATAVIPIVAVDMETDPVQAGWARSLARPGGNVTGLFLDTPVMAGKWVELLRAVAPASRGFGLLWDSGTGAAQLGAAKLATQSLGINTQVIEVRSAESLAAALGRGIGTDIGAMVILGSPMMDSATNAKLIAEFAAGRRLPAISPFRSFADAGGLMSYGPGQDDFLPRAGGFVARILKGAKPSDLAIELPSKFLLVLNGKAARAMGLTLPQALRLRADEVIE